MPGTTQDFPEFAIAYSTEARGEIRSLANSQRFAIMEVADALAEQPDKYPAHTVPVMQDVFVYRHPQSRLEITYRIDREKKIIYVLNIAVFMQGKKVFISYSDADKELAWRVSDMLKAAGFEVWDTRQIMPGDNWADITGKALQESAAMVVLLSPASLKSDNVRHEISYALGKKDYRGRIFPVLVVPMEDLPQDNFPWVLKKFPTINLQDYPDKEEGIRRVAELLESADLAHS